MAQFEPKKLNIGEINDGKRFNNGDGVSAEAINAPIEAALYAEEIAQEAIGVKEQVQNHEERIAKTEYDTKMLYAIASQKGLYAVAEVEQAYTSRVTADGQNIVDGQKTPVTMIKGSTVRCENLLVYPYPTTSNTTNSGITYTFDEQGVITVNGTSTAISSYYLMNKSSANYLNKAGTYTISMVNGSTSYYLEIEKRDIATNKWLWGAPVNGGSYTFTLNEGEYFIAQIRVASGVTANNQKIYVMLNEGSTALPWQPYFTDLKHAKIDSIVSTGANLLDISKLVGNALVDNGDGTYTMTKNGDKRFSNRWVLNPPMPFNWFYSHMEVLESTLSGGIIIRVVYKDGKSLTHSLQDISTATEWLRDKVIYWVDFYLKGNETDGAYIKFKKPAFTSNVFSKDFYTPFIQETYQLPETLELPEWDRFNPQTGEIIRATGRYVITGNEDWFEQDIGSGKVRFAVNIKTAPTTGDASTANLNVVCSHFKTATGVNSEGCWVVGGTKDLMFRVVYYNFTLEEFVAYLKEQYAAGTPVTIDYILLTPTVEKLEYAPKSYTVYNQGNETAVLENEEFGALPTITNEYIVVL